MDTLQITPLSVFGLLACLVLAAGAGALLHGTYSRRAARMRRRPPEQWPMRQRLITNTVERQIGRWLHTAFADQTLMVKMPVTRFTAPDSPDSGLHWYELLGSLYCTFTVVRHDGRVVGCVDLHNQRAGVRRSQKMKRQLLEQCGLPYLVVEPHNLPDALALRSAFLGEESFVRNDLRQSAAVAEASIRLQNKLSDRRRNRNSDLAPLSGETGADSVFQDDSSGYPLQWQDNSFIAPLDSRKASL